ncbi:MAG: flgL [Solirubrobacterales bacterium]|nr:flgL [Solirubrobacterales bacterium]
MSVRITGQMMTSRVMEDLRTAQTRMARTQQEVSSGKRINQASDDALGANTAVRARAELAGLDKDRDSVAGATSWVSATDSALSDIADVMHRVKELTLKAANSSTTNSGRASIGQELAQLIQTVKDSANAKVGDTYVLAGTATTTPPYAPGAVDTYAGDTGVIARSIGPGVSVAVNTTADTVLGSGGADGKLLSTLRTIQAHLAANDVASLGTTDLAGLDANLDTLTGVQATVGATQNRLDAADSRLTAALGVANDVLDGAEGADLAESIVALNAQSAAYTAALKTSANVMQPSLLDFLR